MKPRLEAPGQLDLGILQKKRPPKLPDPIPPALPGKKRREVGLPKGTDPTVARRINDIEEDQAANRRQYGG